jgi:hypothetical protein
VEELTANDETRKQIPLLLSAVVKLLPVLKDKDQGTLRRTALIVSAILATKAVNEPAALEEIFSYVYSAPGLLVTLIQTANAHSLAASAKRAVICSLLDMAASDAKRTAAAILEDQAALKGFSTLAQSISTATSYPTQSLHFELLYRLWRTWRKRAPQQAEAVAAHMGSEFGAGLESVTLDNFEVNLRAFLNAANAAVNPALAAYPVHTLLLVKDYVPQGCEVILGSADWLDCGPHGMSLYAKSSGQQETLMEFDFDSQSSINRVEIMDRPVSTLLSLILRLVLHQTLYSIVSVASAVGLLSVPFATSCHRQKQ